MLVPDHHDDDDHMMTLNDYNGDDADDDHDDDMIPSPHLCTPWLSHHPLGHNPLEAS